MNCIAGLKKFLVIILVIVSTSVFSRGEDHKHDHDHDHHLYELGVANSFVYFPGEKASAYGLHLHLVRSIKNSNFGFGIAYERVFDKHKHNTIGVVGSFSPIKSWHINFVPGIAFEDSELADVKFAFHIETSYGFSLRNFHIGPLLEYAFDPNDYHFSLGLHIGFGF